jgi:hypothetical protein
LLIQKTKVEGFLRHHTRAVSLTALRCFSGFSLQTTAAGTPIPFLGFHRTSV